MARKIYAAALAAITLVSAGAAHAAPVEDEFARICLSSKTASEAAVKARAEGYLTMPPPLRAAILKVLKNFPDDAEMLWRAGEGEMSVFMGVSITRERSRHALTGDGCVIASAPPQPSLQAKMERMLNVGRAQPFGNDSAYIFEMTDNGPVRLDGSEKALMGVKALQGSVRVATAVERQDMSGLMLMIPSVATR